MYESEYDDYGSADEQAFPVQSGRPPMPFNPSPAPSVGVKPNPAPSANSGGSTGLPGLSALPSYMTAFRNAVVSPVAGGLQQVMQSQPVQQKVLQGQGFKPMTVDYSAPGNQPPVSAFVKETPGQTEYRVPGKGSATFQGQRKGGGSFTVAATRTPEEQQAIDASVAGINAQTDALRRMNGQPTLAEEQQQQARERDFAQMRDWLAQFAPEPGDLNERRQTLLAQLQQDQGILGRSQREAKTKVTLAALQSLDAEHQQARELHAKRLGLVKEFFGGLLGQEQQQTQQQQEQVNTDRKLDQSQQKLDFDRMTARERAELSRDWLQFQRWRSERSDKRPRSDSRSMKPAYISPP